MESYNIRKAEITDAAALALIQVKNYRASYADFFPQDYLDHFSYEEQTQDWKDLLLDMGSKILLIAETSEHQPAGYILLDADQELYPGYDAEIIALHVLESYRKSGIGKSLLAGGLSLLVQKQCSSVMLWTLEKNPIRSWYEMLSGNLMDKKSCDMDGWIVNEVAYGWASIKTLLQSIRVARL